VTTSNTIAFNPDQVSLIEEACSVAGFEVRTGYDLRSARFALNMLLMEWANRGLNLWTLTSGSLTLVANTATYALPENCVDVLDAAIRTNVGNTATQADLKISRISMPTYLTLPNKLSTGRPLQFFIDRQISPTITFWPIPDDSQTWTAVYYYLRRLQDAGSTANLTSDVPFRFYPALISGLAYQMALRKPELLERVPMLKAMYEEQFQLASDEDREKAPLRLVPHINRV
jgi:hypothetical protein